jgi:hypothetical protein
MDALYETSYAATVGAEVKLIVLSLVDGADSGSVRPLDCDDTGGVVFSVKTAPVHEYVNGAVPPLIVAEY